MADRTVIIPEAPRGASQLIEIPVTTNGAGKVPLPVVQQLQNDGTQTVIIRAIRVIPVTVLARGVNTNAVNMPLTEAVKLTLTLYSQGWEKGQNIPLLALNDIDDGGTTPFRFHTTKFDDWKNVDWNKSFLQFGNGSVSAGTPYVVMLEVEYLRLNPVTGAIIEGAN